MYVHVYTQVLSLPLSLWQSVASPREPTALACLYEAISQGILTRHNIDLHEPISRLLQSQPFAASSSSSSVQSPDLDPWALPLVLKYSSACCLDHTPLPPHPPPFTMRPILPADIKAILVGLPTLPSAPSLRPFGAAASACDLLSPLTSSMTSGHRCHHRHTRSCLSSSFLRPASLSKNEQQPHATFPALLALVYALHFSKESQRCQGPFPPPFDYDVYSLPIPRFLSMARHGLMMEGGEAWAHLYEKFVGLALDHFPELYVAETLVGGEVGGLTLQPSSISLLSKSEVDERQVLQDLRQVLKGGPNRMMNTTGGDPADVGCRWLMSHGQSHHPGAFEKDTLEILLERAANEEGGPGIAPYHRTGACQEPLLVFRSPPWVFTTPSLLRVVLRLLRSLTAASRLQASRASAMKMWKAELLATRVSQAKLYPEMLGNDQTNAVFSLLSNHTNITGS